jgi:beta-lactamase class A
VRPVGAAPGANAPRSDPEPRTSRPRNRTLAVPGPIRDHRLMQRIAATLSLLFLVSCATAQQGAGPGPAVDAIIASHPQQTIAVSYHDLGSGTVLERNARESFHAASTMKVPVMFAAFQAVSRGELQLEQPVPVKNEFTSIFDGSRYALESREDSDKELYERVGQTVALEELIRRMIVRSSNLATNLVIEFVGAPRVMSLMKEIGAQDIRVLRGVEDDKAYHAGMNNTTTAHDLMLILKALAEERVISAEASRRMTGILLEQEFNDGIPSGVAKGSRVAHKTGNITKIAHDAAVVYDANGSRYVLVILTRGFETTEAAEKVMGEITRAIVATRR